jgi:pyridoxal phosphate enzyme (YggS family)
VKTAGTSVADRLGKIKAQIQIACHEAKRDPSSVQLLAVSKLKPAASVREAYEAGQVDFGENYVQEVAEKRMALVELHARWHMIGHLQTNKARAAIDQDFALIHSVDSVRLAKKLADAATETGKIQSILLQINVGGEISKSGAGIEDLDALVSGVLPLKSLRVRGLMTMPPLGENPTVARAHFAKLRELLNRARAQVPSGDRLHHSMDQLSMGTSHDFREAIFEGATWLRIGTDIFGERGPE